MYSASKSSSSKTTQDAADLQAVDRTVCRILLHVVVAADWLWIIETKNQCSLLEKPTFAGIHNMIIRRYFNACMDPIQCYVSS